MAVLVVGLRAGKEFALGGELAVFFESLDLVAVHTVCSPSGAMRCRMSLVEKGSQVAFQSWQRWRARHLRRWRAAIFSTAEAMRRWRVASVLAEAIHSRYSRLCEGAKVVEGVAGGGGGVERMAQIVGHGEDARLVVARQGDGDGVARAGVRLVADRLVDGDEVRAVAVGQRGAAVGHAVDRPAHLHRPLRAEERDEIERDGEVRPRADALGAHQPRLEGVDVGGFVAHGIGGHQWASVGWALVAGADCVWTRT